MSILEDRGLFWWNSERIPSGAFAPESAIGGTLKIDDSGSIRLELDGRMPTEKPPLAAFLDGMGQPTGRNIQGILKGDAGYVLLMRLTRNGGAFKTNGISYEIYVGLECLICRTPFRTDHRKPLTFRSFKMGLAGFEKWLWLHGFEVKTTKSRGSIKYKKERDVHFSTKYGKLSIEYSADGLPWKDWKVDSLAISERAAFRFSSNERMTLDACKTYFQRLEELLLLLTDSEYFPGWPTLTSANGANEITFYFTRNKSTDTGPGAHECMINFPKIRNEIGLLFSNLVEKREVFGPGFYLYLGIRRGMKMFVEHRFVNLIWGLEAFDRRVRTEAGIKTPLQLKIDRILTQVTNARDNKWLARQLKHAGEPNLGQRLFDIFIKLPLRFDVDGLRNFCEKCAERRNDISHFGGRRSGGESYNDFIREIDKMTDAVASLYHLHLLNEIGIPHERLDFKINNNWPLSRMERGLREAGVLTPTEGEPL